MKRNLGWIAWAAACVLAVSRAALAEDTEALAKAAQNPIANMISLPFQNNTTLNAGPEKQTQNVLNIQPVIPVKLNADWNLITRTILPVISQPGFVPGQDRVNGIGDTQLELFVSPAKPGKLIWGLGPILQLPTNSNDVLGTKKWGIGPAVVLLTSEGHWLYGVVANNIWSFAGRATPRRSTRCSSNTSSTTTSRRAGTRPPRRTSPPTGRLPATTAGRCRSAADSARSSRSATRRLNGQVQAFYNVVSPDNVGGNWTIRAQLQLLFPK